MAFKETKLRRNTSNKSINNILLIFCILGGLFWILLSTHLRGPTRTTARSEENIDLLRCLHDGYNQDFSKWGGGQLVVDSFPPDLSSLSVIVDIGGYTGVSLEKYWQNYQPYMYVFEPVLEYFEILNQKFFDASQQNKFTGFNYGISSTNKTAYLVQDGDASRTLDTSPTGKYFEIQLQTFDQFYYDHLAKKHRGMIDLLYINCEQCEYEVLEYLIRFGWHLKAKNILVQFHPLGNNGGAEGVYRRCKLRSLLQESHTEVFNYPFIWEGWKLRN